MKTNTETKMNAEEKKHAKYSASGSHRWLECPGSVELCSRAPAQKESKYAKEGTDAHACLEWILTNGTLSRKWPDEMYQHAHAAAKVIWEMQRESADAPLFVEQKISLEFIAPEMFGTADAVIAEPFGTLTVIDFKYGAGIVVDPKDNTQMLYYALGVAHAHDYNFEKVRLVIIQPRAEHDGGIVREHIFPIEELMMWEEFFRRGVEACEDPLAPLKAGEHCRFCPAAAICPEISSKAMVQAKIDFQDGGELLLPVLKSEGVPQLSEKLKAAELLELWIDKLREHAQHELEAGRAVPGFKLVAKRGIRKWADPEVAEKMAVKKYGKQVLSVELLSPAQIEKRFGAKEFVAKYAHEVSSGNTMVSENDPRPAVVDELFKTETISVGPEKVEVSKKPPKKKWIMFKKKKTKKVETKKRKKR